MERPAFSFAASPCNTAASFARFWTSRWPGKPTALPPSANQLLAAPWAGHTLRQRLGVIEQPLSGLRTVVNSDLLLRLHPFLVCGSKKRKATDMGSAFHEGSLSSKSNSSPSGEPQLNARTEMVLGTEREGQYSVKIGAFLSSLLIK
ncbi:hypothetical protein TESG_08424 [Trichophyton tonsurans CBS 112818]|uniref:Uncharacterized protein n=1 Tax=Trichophyton tonsurans (strain CBS 112818) TaxID=647933 RepID=F2RXT4_TRIT1|nr:hypothetical protein TESG_08424 [Trichophyton tonsurans CBS 112818]